jgi:ribosome-interacting GTPase 1
MTEERKQITTSGWSFMGDCCNPCMGRKQAPKSVRDELKASGMMKIVLLGNAESGKSRVLSVLSEEIKASSAYSPTNGTRNIRLVTPGQREISLVEVGGNLVQFWPRAIDSKVDAVWYILTKAEYEKRDVSQLTGFLREVRELLNTRSMDVLVTVMGVSGLSLETAKANIVPLVSDCGVNLPIKVSVCGDFEKVNVLLSLEPLVKQ